MPRKKGTIRNFTEEDYARLYRSIEEKIDIDELSAKEIRELISDQAYEGLDRGRKDLLLLAKTLRGDIERASSVEELKQIRIDSGLLLTHRGDIDDLILIKSADLLEGDIVFETWKRFGEVEVLREANGRLISWRKI